MFINAIFRTCFLIAHLEIAVITDNKTIKIHTDNYFEALIVGT